MILIDTSVWIDLLNARPARIVAETELVRFCTCAPVVQEVLQGLRDTPRAAAFRDAFLAMPRLSDPLPLATFLHAADIYRRGRAKGYTVRASADCLIAAIAIEHDVAVCHKDRDFAAIARFTTLKTLAPAFA